jgi:ATP synthase F1 complex assembly factor 2
LVSIIYSFNRFFSPSAFERNICSFFHNNPEPLERLQMEHWSPLLDWARKTWGIQINVSNSVLSVRQPPETAQKLSEVIGSFNHWEMAGVYS